MTAQQQLAQRQRQIAFLNKQPINRAAMKLLPVTWQNPTKLAALTLIQWLIQEKGVEDNFQPGLGSVETMLAKLDRGDPREAMIFLTGERQGEVALQPDSLEGMKVEEAGQTLLQSLVDQMQETAASR